MNVTRIKAVVITAQTAQRAPNDDREGSDDAEEDARGLESRFQARTFVLSAGLRLNDGAQSMPNLSVSMPKRAPRNVSRSLLLS